MMERGIDLNLVMAEDTGPRKIGNRQIGNRIWDEGNYTYLCRIAKLISEFA